MSHSPDGDKKEDQDMREKYEALQMEIIIFHTEDVITGSGGDDDEGDV